MKILISIGILVALAVVGRKAYRFCLLYTMADAAFVEERDRVEKLKR